MTLGKDTLYLISRRFGKEKLHISVILNFISKAHKLGYHIMLTRTPIKDRITLTFTPLEYEFTAYEDPWILDKIGEYAIGMISDVVDDVDLQGMPINRFEYRTMKSTRKPHKKTTKRKVK